MSLENIFGFDNYTNEMITQLRYLFADGKIDSRPIKCEQTIIWLDMEQRIHRTNGPAIERNDGRSEFWIHGERQYHVESKAN